MTSFNTYIESTTQVDKTKQNLEYSINLSQLDPNQTNFVTIFGSVARIHRQGLKEFKALENIRTKFKSR